LTKNRLIIFDLLRLVAISLILASHLSNVGIVNYNGIIFGLAFGTWIGNVFFASLGNIGVILFIFISGAVLELNKKPINTVIDYGKYMFWRLVRLYPAYWLSLLFAIMLLLYANDHTFGNLFWQFSGFSAFVGQWGGFLNPVGWYIGLLVSLYLLFPFISKAMERKPWLILIAVLIIQVIMTYWINITAVNLPIPNTSIVARWFPLCNLFYFGIGIFLVKTGYYLKWEDKTNVISWLGKLTFYVFLFHIPIFPIAVNSGIPIYLAMLVAISMIAMIVDEKIQTKIRTLNLSSLISSISTN